MPTSSFGPITVVERFDVYELTRVALAAPAAMLILYLGLSAHICAAVVFSMYVTCFVRGFTIRPQRIIYFGKRELCNVRLEQVLCVFTAVLICWPLSLRETVYSSCDLLQVCTPVLMAKINWEMVTLFVWQTIAGWALGSFALISFSQ